MWRDNPELMKTDPNCSDGEKTNYGKRLSATRHSCVVPPPDYKQKKIRLTRAERDHRTGKRVWFEAVEARDSVADHSGTSEDSEEGRRTRRQRPAKEIVAPHAVPKRKRPEFSQAQCDKQACSIAPVCV